MSPPSLPSSIGAEYTQPWRPGSSSEWATLQLAPHISLHMIVCVESGFSAARRSTSGIAAARNIKLLGRLDAQDEARLRQFGVRGIRRLSSVGLRGRSFRVRDPSVRADSSARANGREPYACTRV